MTYLKPQSPLQEYSNNNFIYPITTVDQIIINDTNRLHDYIVSDREVESSLSLDNWIFKDNQYEQSIIVKNLNENYNIDVKIKYTGDLNTDLLIKQSANCINYAKQNNEIITFYCLNNKPESYIPIIMGVHI